MRRLLGRRVAWIAAGFAVAAAAAGVAIGATVAANGFVDPSGAYHGCVNTTNGNLRVVEPADACKEHETAIQWSASGGGISRFQDLAGTPCTLRGKPGITVVATGPWAMSAECLMADRWEPNDTEAAATDITDWAGSYGFQATVFPAGDDDWYVVRDMAPSVITAGPIDGGDAFTAELYADGELVATSQENPNGSPYLRYENTEWGYHTWVIHVTSPRLVLYSLEVN